MVALPPLFDRLPEPFAEAYDPEHPWELLGAPLDNALAALPSSRLESPIPPDVHLLGDRIVFEAGVRLAPGVVIEGPVFIGEGVELRPGAYVRGGCWIGAGCIVGASTEVKHSILFPGAKAPHLNYVGDSILGANVNLGAGTVLSNFRHDGSTVTIPCDGERLGTNRRKLGAVLGDDSATGCNCVLHPGVVMGRETQLYPGVHLRAGVYPARTLVKLRQDLEQVEIRS